MSSRENAQYWIEKLQLEAHPEGGYFREIYRSEETISKAALPPQFPGDRSLATSIYFLLKEGQSSHLHKICSDEMWHFYKGLPLDVHMISPEGEYSSFLLGDSPLRGESFFGVVPPGCWFGASSAAFSQEDERFGHIDYSLVGCTVSPGFAFQDFELGRRDTLTQKFPEHRALIAKLTGDHP